MVKGNRSLSCSRHFGFETSKYRMNFEFIVYARLASFQIQNGGCVIRSIHSLRAGSPRDWGWARRRGSPSTPAPVPRRARSQASLFKEPLFHRYCLKGRDGCQSFQEFISASSHFCLNDASRAIFYFCLNRDAVVQVICGVLVTSCGIYTQDSQHPDLKRTIKFVKHA